MYPQTDTVSGQLKTGMRTQGKSCLDPSALRRHETLWLVKAGKEDGTGGAVLKTDEGSSVSVSVYLCASEREAWCACMCVCVCVCARV